MTEEYRKGRSNAIDPGATGQREKQNTAVVR
jgi:hypothetical protein